MSKVNLLRAVTNRLHHTPVKELPHIATFLACSIQSCTSALQEASDQATGKRDDAAIQIHKFKARLSSLLQDRSAEGRFTAVVLVKATVEVGGRAILASCEPWVRALLAILNRQDPLSSKKLCLLTITRIFSLTQQYPTLMREITTPLLPAFLTACMALAGLHQPQGHEMPATRRRPCLETVLQCLLHLIPHHPSTFRPFVPKLQAGLANLIAGQSGPHRITGLAQSVFITLHLCAPKNTAGSVWLNASQAVISSAHETTDRIFRAIIEDWEPSVRDQRQPSFPRTDGEAPQNAGGGPLGLPPWQGMHQGSRVLINLLRLLRTFLLSPTAQVVDMPLGLILDLTSRLTHVRVPASEREAHSSVRFNPEIARDEREELWVVLPEIHLSTLAVLSTVVRTLALSVLPTSQAILDQGRWVFEAGMSNKGVRLAIYDLLNNLLPFLGPSMTRDRFKPLTAVIAACCEDVKLEILDNATEQGNIGFARAMAKNGDADSFLEDTCKKNLDPQIPNLRPEMPAAKLLYRVLEYVPAKSLPQATRAQIDRTAILTNQEQTMLASVLNPSPKTTGTHATPSLIPFLARAASDQLSTEGLLRPRMPLILGDEASTHDADEFEEEEEEEEPVGLKNVNTLTAAETPRQETPARPLINQSEGRMDLLDKLEHSIGNEIAAAPEAVVIQQRGVDQRTIESHAEAESNAVDYGSPQGVKRHFENTDAMDREASTKRLRASWDDTDQENVAPLEATPFGNPHSAVALEMDTPNSTASGEVASGTAIVDNDKTPATDPSAQPKRPGATPDEKINIDDLSDDESDFEMPPLYLKTSSEEGDDEDDDEDDDDTKKDRV